MNPWTHCSTCGRAWTFHGTVCTASDIIAFQQLDKPKAMTTRKKLFVIAILTALFALWLSACENMSSGDILRTVSAVEDVTEKGLRVRDEYRNPQYYRPPMYQPSFRGYNGMGQPIYQ